MVRWSGIWRGDLERVKTQLDGMFEMLRDPRLI